MSVAGHELKDQVGGIDPLIYAVIAGVALAATLTVSFGRIVGLL